MAGEGATACLALPDNMRLSAVVLRLDRLRSDNGTVVPSERIVSWRWAPVGGAYERAEPFYAARMGMRRGRPQEGRAPSDALAINYGFDARDQLVVAAISGELPHLLRGEVWLSQGESVLIRDGLPAGLRRTAYAHGEMVASAALDWASGPSGIATAARYTAEEYVHGAHGLQMIKSVGQLQNPDGSWSDPLRRMWIIERQGGRRVAVEYDPTLAEPTTLSDTRVNDLGARLLPKLVQGVRDQVRAAAIDKPTYMLALFSSEMLPQICIAAEVDRIQMRSGRYRPFDAYLADGYDAINVDADWGFPPNVARQARLLHLELGKRRDHAAGRRIEVELARRLGVMDWQGVLPITDDFVVVSINGALSRDERLDMLRSCLTSERLDELNRREMLVGITQSARRRKLSAPRVRGALTRSLRGAHIRTGKATYPTDLSQVWEAFARFAALPIANVSGDQDQDTVCIEAEPRRQGGLLLILERRYIFDGASETQTVGVEIRVDPNPVISQVAAASASAPADDPDLTTEILGKHASLKAIFKTARSSASVTVFEDA